MLEDVKMALRVKGDSLDTEVEDLISAAKRDLLVIGVDVEKTSDEVIDPLIKRAIILYAKAHFGMGNPDSERFMELYNSLKIHLALSPEYMVVT